MNMIIFYQLLSQNDKIFSRNDKILSRNDKILSQKNPKFEKK